uniref:BAH domain-containing protein n=1 Tax=Neolamprologus brichardi TaxID=32507 RepID=A0A3Q4HZ96_NEOBR
MLEESCRVSTVSESSIGIEVSGLERFRTAEKSASTIRPLAAHSSEQMPVWLHNHSDLKKMYPLRGRAGNSESEGLSCHVLLTRLEENIREKQRSKESKGKDGRGRLSHKSKSKKRKSSDGKEEKSSPKNKLKSCSGSYSKGIRLGVFQPRKRRLASLNAEAVNSLLLERATDPQPAAKQAKRQEEPINAGAFLDADPARGGVCGGLKALRGTNTKGSTSHELEAHQSSKPAKRAKVSRGDESLGMSQECLDAPAPRRLAGLNAAALLKLTSSSATSKQRAKAAPTAIVTSDCKAPVVGSTQKSHSRAKLQHKGLTQKQKGKKIPPLHSGCTACKKAGFEPKVEWETGGCTHRLTKPGYQSRSMLAYPLKKVKEEQLETELSPYYCFPAELTSPSLTHSLPHTALTLSPHPCLCTADHCFSSYYVHIAHPTHTGTTSATMAPRPLNLPPSSLCPSRMSGSKLLGQQVSHPSGLAHPAYCNSVASPCYGDACGISGYTYRAMAPVTSRGCSFSTGCSGCTHNIKTEGYPSPQGDHNPSLLVPPTMPMSSCPLSSVPTSTQTKPHLLNHLSGRDQPQARLRLAKECPKSTKPSGDSLSVGRAQLSTKESPSVPSLSSTKQKRVSRRRATNGWLPVGMPTEREVFIAVGFWRVHLCTMKMISILESLLNEGKPSLFQIPDQDVILHTCYRCYVLPLAQYCRFCALVKRRAEGAPPGSASMVPCRPDFAPPSHRCVPTDVDPELVYLCRHVYDFRYGRILKNLQ